MKTFDLRKKENALNDLELQKILEESEEVVCVITDNIDDANFVVASVECQDVNAIVEQKEENFFGVYVKSKRNSNLANAKFHGVLVLNSDSMGSDEEIGSKLMNACFHTLPDLDVIPKTIILYNSAVKLFENENIRNDMSNLLNLGVDIVSCKTCIEHFNISTQVGSISNMYTILETITNSKKVMYI